MVEAGAVAQIEVFAWATPAPSWTLDALIDHMAQIGNEVLEVDRDGNRLKVLHAVARPGDPNFLGPREVLDA